MSITKLFSKDEIDAKDKVNWWEIIKVKMEETLDNIFASILLVVATLWWLYLDDVRSGFTDKSDDYYFDSLFIVWLVIFLIEFIISWLSK